MKIQIKNRFDDSVIFEYDCEDNTIKKIVIEAVKNKISLRGAYLRWADLRGAYLRWADLQGADLRWADLQGANLRGADLRWADLQGADLQGADLQGADLRGAYLRGADLRGANLRGADLDFSCWDLSCKTLHIKSTSKRLRVQLCFHWLTLIENQQYRTEEEKELYNACLKYANKFHRIVKDVEPLKPLQHEKTTIHNRKRL